MADLEVEGIGQAIHRIECKADRKRVLDLLGETPDAARSQLKDRTSSSASIPDLVVAPQGFPGDKVMDVLVSEIHFLTAFQNRLRLVSVRGLKCFVVRSLARELANLLRVYIIVVPTKWHAIDEEIIRLTMMIVVGCKFSWQCVLRFSHLSIYPL